MHLEKYFQFQKRQNIYFQKIEKNKPFATLKLVSPSSGIIEVKNNNIFVNNKILLNLLTISNQFPNCKIKFSLLAKNYQYIDSLTLIGYLEIHAACEGEIWVQSKKKFHKILKQFF